MLVTHAVPRRSYLAYHIGTVAEVAVTCATFSSIDPDARMPSAAGSAATAGFDIAPKLMPEV